MKLVFSGESIADLDTIRNFLCRENDRVVHTASDAARWAIASVARGIKSKEGEKRRMGNKNRPKGEK
jgi:hypothetical protein